MKGIILAALLTASLFGSDLTETKHQVFTNLTKKIELTGIKKELIFFGHKEKLLESYDVEYRKAMLSLDTAIKGLEYQSDNIAKGLIGSGIKGLNAGAWAGILFSVIDPYVMSLYADKEYLLIYDLTNSKGQKTRISSLFVASSFDNEDEIRAYLDAQIKSKIEVN